MTPETAPEPATSTATQWEAVPTTQVGQPVPAEAPPGPDQELVLRATVRRGIPSLAMAGWALALLGLTIVAITYDWSIGFSTRYRVAGVRGDFVGAGVLLLGAIIALLFLFIPSRRAIGVLPTASADELDEQVRYTNGQVLLSQTLVGSGLGMAMLGLGWMIAWLYLSFNRRALQLHSGYGTPMDDLGAFPLWIGLATMFYFLGRVGMARHARNLAVVARHRGPAAGVAGLAGGVTEAEVRNLVKRLDGLMARLPDDAVTEFSRTPEADTYLKLLGS